ncbi:3-oxoacyl-[acyl-carrier-protein] reductase [Pelagicoccus mobilis]|nr:3-oxoacyl-[acyl-carrier-protein] reductase [Pelagicoccus mobilis]
MKPTAKPLKGKRALVTGGSRGIGRAIAIELAQNGCDVIVNYCHSDEAAEETQKAIEEYGVECELYKADISNRSECDKMVADLLEKEKCIHILVNNAGINRDRTFLKMTCEMWDEVLGVNLNGPFNVTHGLLPAMVDNHWGRIINISSMGGQTGNFGQANYSVTKGGINAFTMTLAREVARKGVTVNSVSPGYTETDMTNGIPETVSKQICSSIPMGRMATPEEIASAVSFIASPKASYITGQVIGVNGGMYM